MLGSGVRTLLQFTVQTANISQYELLLGDPTSSPFFVFSPCHGHYHLQDFSDYQLRDLGGGPMVSGQKYDWCLVDVDQYIFEPWVPAAPIHDCDYQGLAPGWSDVYGNRTPCQWVDVTDVPNGTYLLRATVNPRRVFPESVLSNNSAEVQVTVADPAGGVLRVPDGAVSQGTPVTVRPETGGHRVTWDVTTCRTSRYNLYYSLKLPSSQR